MIWLGIAIGAIVLIIAIGVLTGRRSREVHAADIDPLFATGIALTGAGVALATTIGAVMYAVMTVGLIAMAMGAHRTRHHRNG